MPRVVDRRRRRFHAHPGGRAAHRHGRPRDRHPRKTAPKPLEILVREAGAFDLLLTDIQMPVMDGIGAGADGRRATFRT